MEGSRKERKVVTVLFADLVGFTARAEQPDLKPLAGVSANNAFAGEALLAASA